VTYEKRDEPVGTDTSKGNFFHKKSFFNHYLESKTLATKTKKSKSKPKDADQTASSDLLELELTTVSSSPVAPANSPMAQEKSELDKSKHVDVAKSDEDTSEEQLQKPIQKQIQNSPEKPISGQVDSTGDKPTSQKESQPSEHSQEVNLLNLQNYLTF
jgi:hypothetical protein